MARRLGRFISDRRGATMIEYGLLCALLAMLLFLSIEASGGRALSIMGRVATAVSGI